ncbi:Mitochondrial import inner membrane translocase subunit Tim17 family protein [Trichomonas vaginalis G3]|uniref:Mitochondrial import inner membrane translocase subunit Tim17 family protein n=1 Tax=Trichomonas vaginalis (strain ATCC PRA-98 / G3) TaxID=412133 RepID=A2E7V5_TRIV3|nr:hypothetical protein TVAGG3_0282610 [Trichomonas vaginalis G3]EAY11286.1 Mitochondrial import inner membrane translocase subunit Tim17 family protein [Trichomonas vaginalis G3]KAI5526672.1 hypothetical protein TVAGG3_0282610 [Trichomonas vaginalis G3]|eukprot:XP_001323509.1 Mitochondrial import inner membrane translocase subunit Tim17 family protein [Trichomonas vaginalis G3]
MQTIRELVDYAPIAEDIGKSFIIGYGAGTACGLVVGFSRNHDNLPLITLNDTLNCIEKYSGEFGYTFGIAAGLHTLSCQLSKNLKPIQKHAIAGGVAGTFIGSHWGMKGAIGGGVVGAALGAGYGYASTNPELLKYFTK